MCRLEAHKADKGSGASIYNIGGRNDKRLERVGNATPSSRSSCIVSQGVRLAGGSDPEVLIHKPNRLQ